MFSMIGLVEALDLRQGTLTLRSRKNYPLGTQTKVRVQVPPGSGKIVNLPVQIEEKLAEGIYRASLLTRVEGLEFKGSDPILRSRPRHSVHLRVRSREIPGFQATATDLSASGAQLEDVQGAVPSGTQMVLHIDLEGWRKASLSSPAEVVRCRRKGQGYELGLRFLHPTPEAAREMAELSQFVGRRENSDLRSLLDAAKRVEPLETGRALPAQQPVAATTKAAPTSLFLPVRARLDGYSRNVTSGSLYLRLLDQQEAIHTLEFPECQLLKDHDTVRCQDIDQLRSQGESAWISEVKVRLGPGLWKHYALLSASGDLLLELISRPLRSG